MMRKITVLALSAVFVALSVPVEAQQSGKIPRIGILVSASASNATRRVQALQQGLHQLGYVEGKNIIIEYRYAEGELEPLIDFADELVRLKVDVIVADTSVATQAAKNATKTIPICLHRG
jgi:putative ABC transport system substrate-binding protein